MKQKLLLKVMLLLCALVAGSSSVWAVDPASFGPSNFTGQGTSGTGSAISATVDGVTFSCDKGYCTDQIRCYSGGKITISSSNTITAISFTFSGSTYTGGMETSYSDLSTTSWEKTLSSQARLTAISVTYTVSGVDYNVTLGAVTNGTIETNKAKAKSGETVTLTATPGSGYVTGNWTVTDASSNNVAVTKTGANTATFTMPAKDVTVSATFLVKHTITYYVAGVENTVDRGHGTSLSLDNPVLGSLEFAGWSSTNNAASPSFVANSTAVNADMTLYAIFVAKKEAASYNLVEASQADWRGDYLIAYSASAFASGKAKGADGIGSASTVQNPGTKLDGKAVDGAWGDEYHVTLEAIDDNDLSKGYLLKTQDGYYNYMASNNNGISGTSKVKNTASSYPITVNYISSSEINLTLDKGQVFRYNTSEKYFRYYKSTSYSSQGKVYLYKAAGYTYTYTLAEPFEVSISSAKYATFCDEIPRNFSTSGITVFTAASDGSKVDLTEITDGIVPANTGVVLYSDEVKNNVAIPVATTDPAGDFSGNELVGINVRTMVNATASTKTNYILSKETAGVGFYKATDGKYLGAHKAYLSTANAATAPSFLGFDINNDVTSINEIKATKVDGIVYDLQGRKVAQPSKGLYIVNGKKVVIK